MGSHDQSNQGNLFGDPLRAAISLCGRYRYALWRDTPSATAARDQVLFILLNPSTADADNDDPTVRKLQGFARRWGFRRLAVGNIFAFRSTDPDALREVEDPVGPSNDRWLASLAKEADLVVCGWGSVGSIKKLQRTRVERVLRLLRHETLHALKLNDDGSPGHPLYLPYELPPFRYDPPLPPPFIPPGGGVSYPPDALCRWCGSPYADHLEYRPHDAPVPRVPCTLLKSHFVPKELQSG